jgi:UDP-glucose 4-epimerase
MDQLKIVQEAGSDHAKAKFLLGSRAAYNLQKMIDSAWDYQRTPDDSRMVWYPG